MPIKIHLLGNNDILMACDCGNWQDVIPAETLRRPMGEAFVGFALLLGLGHVQHDHDTVKSVGIAVVTDMPVYDKMTEYHKRSM
jgi:hypothetical protein